MLATASPVVELDFARTQAGVVPDKMSSNQIPATIQTFSIYDRLRGESAIPKKGKLYPRMALGRTGELTALRLGNGKDGLGPMQYRFETGKPFAVELWVYVYNVENFFFGSILTMPPGPVYGNGFSLGFQKEKWSRNGWLEWRLGDGSSSKVIWHKGFIPEQWHQIAICSDGSTITLYIDGELSDCQKMAIPFGKDGRKLFLGKQVPRLNIDGLDFKTDQFVIYNNVLTADEIKAHYKAGTPTQSFTAEQESELVALKLQIPHTSYGYFHVGQKIPVLIDKNSIADTLIVNGKIFPLPLEQEVVLQYSTPGIRLINMSLLSNGKTLKTASYPVEIVPTLPTSSKLGVADLATRQPEVTALGMHLNRVVINWAEIEPRKQEYDWTRLDTIMKRSKELEAKTVLCLTGIPKWVTLAEGSANVPADLTRFRKIWRLLVNRYDGIKYFEVWSAYSPSNSLKGTNKQKLQDYVTLLQAAAETIYKEHKDAEILAGRLDISDGIATASYLDKHASNSFNIFSGRHYTMESNAQDNDKMWSSKIVKVSNKPVWNTACGVQQFARNTLLPTKDTSADCLQKAWPMIVMDEQQGASLQIKDVAIQLANGIDRIILDSGPSEYYPLRNGTTGLPGLKGMALAVFNSLLPTDSTLTHLADLQSGLFAIQFSNPKGHNGIILFTSGSSIDISIDNTSKNAILLDLFGNKIPFLENSVQITETPIYLLNVEKINNVKEESNES